jgi:hypothetical protein
MLKSALARRQAISGISSFITQNEHAIDKQLVLYGAERSSHTRIGCWKKADQRHERRAGV